MPKNKDIEEKITIWDRLKINLMCKWLEDYGFQDDVGDFPELQLKFAKRLEKFLTPPNEE